MIARESASRRSGQLRVAEGEEEGVLETYFPTMHISIRNACILIIAELPLEEKHRTISEDRRPSAAPMNVAHPRERCYEESLLVKNLRCPRESLGTLGFRRLPSSSNGDDTHITMSKQLLSSSSDKSGLEN